MKRLPFLLFVLCLPLTIFSQTLEVEPFEKKLNETPGAILLDVRTTGEFGGGHLPKAKNMDFRSSDFANQIKTLPKDQPIFVYCLSGGRSAQAAELLKKEGYQVTELKGGYLKWTTKLKPVEGVPAVSHDPAWDLAAFAKETKEGKAVVVDFYAKWCAPCLKMMPTVDKLAGDFAGRVKVVKVEADGNQAVLQQFGIDEIPSFLVFQNGKIIQKTSGFREEAQLKELFDQAIGIPNK
jgi:thioredoxin